MIELSKIEWETMGKLDRGNMGINGNSRMCRILGKEGKCDEGK